MLGIYVHSQLNNVSGKFSENQVLINKFGVNILAYLRGGSVPMLNGVFTRQISFKMNSLQYTTPNHISVLSFLLHTKIWNCMCLDMEGFEDVTSLHIYDHYQQMRKKSLTKGRAVLQDPPCFGPFIKEQQSYWLNHRFIG